MDTDSMRLSDIIALTRDPSLSMASGGIRTVTDMLDLMALPPYAGYLEIGCAAGDSANRVAAKRPDVRVIGVDPQADAVTAARRIADQWGLTNAVYMVGDARDVPLPTHAFHGVSIGNILAFVPAVDRMRVLTECARVVADGGVVIACPLYYPGKLPPAHTIDAVEEAIGAPINRGSEQHWLDLYQSAGLHLVGRRARRFRVNSDDEIVAYCERVMASRRNDRHPPEVRQALGARLLELHRLFAANNRYLGYSVLAWQTTDRNVEEGLLLRSDSEADREETAAEPLQAV